jgi:hypothetical protein
MSPADLTLVRDGQPACAIVLAKEATRAARSAAVELQNNLRLMSGAEVPIAYDDDPPQGTRILVGDSSLTAALGLNSDDFDIEQILVRVIGNDLIVMGDDAKPSGTGLQGTYLAACELLENVLGVRWLWPGELGTVIPERATVTVPADLNITITPRLLKRNIRNIQWNARVQRGLDKLGFTREQFDEVHRDGAVWSRRHRIGGSFRGGYGHAYGNFWETYGADQPDWFALQPDGTRDQSKVGNRARLCVSNQELIAEIARLKIEELQANPDLDCVSISPNDGGASTFCTCKSCEAWDSPDGPMIQFWWPDTDNHRIDHVSLSDRFFRFYSAIAEIVAQQCPDRMLGAYAYSAYTSVPIDAPVHPNLLVGFVGLNYMNRESGEESLERWRGWSAKAGHLFLRPNLLGGGMSWPVNFARRLGKDTQSFIAGGLTVTDFDCCYQHWATKGLTYYVLAEVLWNPSADVDALISDYCRAGWGPAAGEVESYFLAIERKTDEIYEASTYIGRKQSESVMAAFYTDEFLDQCQGYLDAARVKAAGDETILARIDFLQAPIDYARLNRDWRLMQMAVRAGDGDKQKAYEAATEAKERFFQDLGISWAINTPYLKFYGF